MSRECILIVEDESVVAMNVSQIVESLGYRPVGPIGTGAGALKLLHEERVDLVLMDIKLKGRMDGVELARRINAIRPVPIVFLTAYTDETTLARAKGAEPYGYITKSFDEGELHSTIEMALYKFEMEQKIVREERLLATTLENILEGVITTDVRGRIRYMNPAAIRLLGVDLHRAKGKRLDSVIQLRSNDERVISSLTATDGTAGDHELDNGARVTIHGHGRPEIPVEWKARRINPFENSDVRTVHLVRDLTTQLKAETAQRRLASVVESSEDAIITISIKGVIESWNTGAEKIFGYSSQEAVGRNLTMITTRTLPVDMADMIERVAGGENVGPFEIICRRSDGEPVDIAIAMQGMRDYTGSYTSISLIARDVTTRRNLDKKLHEILNKEQTRIGQDLHDSIGQMLTGILFKAKAVERSMRAKGVPGEADTISDITELLSTTLLNLRELARGLVPATILSDGFVFALRRLAEDTQSLCGLKVGFMADSEVSVSDDVVSTELYHIVEEALNNAVKHSACREITVRVQSRPEELVVSVCDDGRGIPQQVDQDGLGLKIMRHRAGLIGASFSVTSSASGTRVVCKLSVANR